MNEPTPINRQQRRAAERADEKARTRTMTTPTRNNQQLPPISPERERVMMALQLFQIIPPGGDAAGERVRDESANILVDFLRKREAEDPDAKNFNEAWASVGAATE